MADQEVAVRARTRLEVVVEEAVVSAPEEVCAALSASAEPLLAIAQSLTSHRSWWFWPKRLRPTRYSHGDGYISTRLRIRNRMHLDQFQNPILQRTNLPREQDIDRQSRRDPWTDQPGLLHYQANRRYSGNIIQVRRQVLYWR